MDEQGWSKLYSGSAVSESPPGASRFYVIKGTGCEAETRLGREVFRKGRFEDGRRLLHVAVCSVCRNILVKDHGTFFSVLPHRERSKGEASAIQADRVIFGPLELGPGVRLAFVIWDDAIVELYEEK